MTQETTIGALIDAVDAADKAASIVEGELRQATERLQAARDALIKKMREENTTSAANSNIKVSLSEGVRPQVQDWEAFYEFVKRHKAYQLFERRIAKKAFEEVLESRKGKEVPGVTLFAYDRLTVRRS